MTLASGNKADMEKAIELLEEVKEGIINAYVRKTGLSRNKISKLMDEETWMNAEKALQLGFVDGILFDDKKNAPEPEEDEQDESDEDTPDEDETPEEDDSKTQKTASAMLYSSNKTMASFMQKITAEHGGGTPISQLEKRLELLKY
jgi:ATP-dependent Clp protease protease subunit